MSADSRAFFSAIVLAAGRSRRMGRRVALLPLAGRPVLQHVIDAAAASHVDEIVLVLDAAAREVCEALSLPNHLRVAEAHDAAEGQGASLVAGLRAVSAKCDAAVVLLGDQPGVDAASIDLAIDEFRTHDAPAVRPVHGERRIPGHPVILDRSLWPRLHALRGDAGARALLAAHSDWLHTFPIEGDPPADLDTWDDYLRVRDGWKAPSRAGP